MKVIREGVNPDNWFIGYQTGCQKCGRIVEFEESDRDKWKPRQVHYDQREPDYEGVTESHVVWKCDNCGQVNFTYK